MSLERETQDWVLAATGAASVRTVEPVQQLWSGYGQLSRLHLDIGAGTGAGTGARSVILKHIAPPARHSHPRGWTGERADRRKRRSYAVEASWYRRPPPSSDDGCPWPHALAIRTAKDRVELLLEDLAIAYPQRPARLDHRSIEHCLHWLAAFHARHLGDPGDALWRQGCYWHLDTRPDELAAMPEGPLKRAAPLLDARLRRLRHPTLVHGDAKLANFLFSEDGERVAAVDFQYVGQGTGTRDLAYLLGSCLTEAELTVHHDRLLDRYDRLLVDRLAQWQPAVDGSAVAAEWRALHPIAWADFHRFLSGWSPGHAKLTRHAQRLTDQALHALHAG